MTPLNILCLNNTLSRKLLTVLMEEEDFKLINNLEYFNQIEDIYPAQKIDILIPLKNSSNKEFFIWFFSFWYNFIDLL